MGNFKSAAGRLGGSANAFEETKPKVYRYVFGEQGEFGSVTFRRIGKQTEVLELIEPEHGDEPVGPLKPPSDPAVAEEPAGGGGPDVAGGVDGAGGDE